MIKVEMSVDVYEQKRPEIKRYWMKFCFNGVSNCGEKPEDYLMFTDSGLGIIEIMKVLTMWLLSDETRQPDLKVLFDDTPK